MAEESFGLPLNIAPPPRPEPPPPPPELVQAAKDFESMVLAQLMQPMFAAMDTDGLGGGGFGEQIFRPMLVDEYAKGMSRSGGVGLADSIIAEMQRLQMSLTPEQAAALPIEGAKDGADRR